jgi:molybdopterin/thiamine biosynthesis adenylyltransferase/nitroreductase
MPLLIGVERIYTPILIDRTKGRDNEVFLKLVQDYSQDIILDHYASQKKELFKIAHPTTRLSDDELNNLYDTWKDGVDVALEGMWVFYPWSGRLIHILAKDEFIRLRTSRNQYKISGPEQQNLMSRKIGIVGLSVGSAVALTMATERICGTLKLADFDTIELSNLNRIKTGIHNIGINKCVVTAREIAEIDPYIEIECYPEGITEDNLQSFLTGGGKLDILVDECDDIEMKIRCRQAARDLEIPVLMETSDRGMLDVERFDLEASRPLFHGMLVGIPEDKLVNLSPAERLPLVMKIVDVMKSSTRARMSLLEIGQSITTWPQLASAVTLGGAVVTDTCRRILLGNFVDSGRFYVDLEQIVYGPGSSQPEAKVNAFTNSFDLDRAVRITDSLSPPQSTALVTQDQVIKIVEAASMAPSSGNDQPWKWIFCKNSLHLFHDRSRSQSSANFKDRTSELSLGAAVENATLKAAQLGLSMELVPSPLPEEPDLIASIKFVPPDSSEVFKVYFPELADYIASRSTNRAQGMRTAISDEHLTTLSESINSIAGARAHFITEPDRIRDLAGVVAECNLISILNEHGHDDFFERHIHWPGGPESEEKNIGIKPEALGAPPNLLAALTMLKDKKVAKALRTIGGGKMLIDAYRNTLMSTSCFALISLPREMENKYFHGGMAIQKFWLTAEQLGYAIQPLDSPQQLFFRLSHDGALLRDEIEKIRLLREVFRSITNLRENLEDIFLLKIIKANTPTIRANRLPLTEILFMSNNEI